MREKVVGLIMIMKYFPTCGQTVWKSGFVGQHSAVRGRTTVGSPVRRITFSRKGNCISSLILTFTKVHDNDRSSVYLRATMVD